MLRLHLGGAEIIDTAPLLVIELSVDDVELASVLEAEVAVSDELDEVVVVREAIELMDVVVEVEAEDVTDAVVHCELVELSAMSSPCDANIDSNMAESSSFKAVSIGGL